MGHKSKDGLGQALIRQQRSDKAQRQRAIAENKPVLESVIDVRDLDTVVEEAELAGRVFSSLNPLPEVLVAAEASDEDGLSPEEKQKQQKAEEALHQSSLKIPRRPQWHGNMTSEQLDAQERQSFLNWRRELARLEENDKLVITPFEKNLDIWRQLWRVIERSDLVVTVVDARNPLFYRCPDLEAYVKEVDPFKETMLLVNKADLLPAAARLKWAEYFTSQGLSFLFWSAKNASEGLEQQSEQDDLSNENMDVTQILSRDELLHRLTAEAEHISKLRQEAVRNSLTSHVQQYTTQQLEKATDAESVNSAGVPSRQAVVGFVGYPNVGKSSTINALVGEKRTGVTSTPGKTKHFQTLIISEKLMLCDCPGLVFPSFTSSRSEMVASGVLPIDRLTDHRGPVQVVANLVPRATLERLYGIVLPKPKPYEPQDRPPAAYELLHTFCQSRGYVASAGLADETRAARQILKDYVNGKLLHYHLPPVDSALEADEDSLSLEHGSGNTENLEYQGVMAHLDSFDSAEGLKPATANEGKKSSKDVPSHKMHKKMPRRKDRSWRAGNDQGDGMPLVRGVAKPVSHGAAQLASVTN